jgi:hypothetical protein
MACTFLTAAPIDPLTPDGMASATAGHRHFENRGAARP